MMTVLLALTVGAGATSLCIMGADLMGLMMYTIGATGLRAPHRSKLAIDMRGMTATGATRF